MRNWRSANPPERSFSPFLPMPQGILSPLSYVLIFFLTFLLFLKRSVFLFYFPLCHKFIRTSAEHLFRSRGKYVISTSFWPMEVANGVLLKEKGFDGMCMHLHDGEDCLVSSPENWNEDSCTMSIPTHQMACAWLRQKGFHIYVFNSDVFAGKWTCEIQNLKEDESYYLSNSDTYEEAVEAAI